MPTIDIDYSELQKLIHAPIENLETLDDILANVKSEIKQYNKTENTLSIEVKDTNRPDLWSVEGMTRALQGYLGNAKGSRKYTHAETAAEVHVDKRLRDIRPYICCSIVKDMQLTDTIVRGMMHLQDKLDQTYGRNRRKTSIGIYDFDLITPPLNYTVAEPKAFSFVPLGFTKKMNLAEILERHPKGIEYGQIVKKHSLYPILLDAEQKVLSFPPIINSNDLGRITDKSRNLLVEVTGTSPSTVLNTLNLVTLALLDRGGKAYAATIDYPDDPVYAQRRVVTPDFQSRTVSLSVEYTNRLLGLQLNGNQIRDLLLIAGFDISSVEEATVNVQVPCYRTDIMHQVDLIEDVAVAYGYNNIQPFWRELPTTGRARTEQRLLNVARELMAGLGYQEIATYTLTNPDNLFNKMHTEPTQTVEIANPKVATMTCLRNWLLPSLMEFLGTNQSVEFPQCVFELGKVTFFDAMKETRTRDEEWLAAATSHATAGFTEMKSALDAFFMNLGLTWQIQEAKHPSFIEGRMGEVHVDGKKVGVLGEINPAVLAAWNLENPAAAFEINMTKVLALNAKS